MNDFVQEIYGKYQKAANQRCLWAMLFGLASFTLDYFGMRVSPSLALVGMVMCIILADRCHWESIYFLKKQINKERNSFK